jgi:Zn-dependent protease with chaperone function
MNHDSLQGVRRGLQRLRSRTGIGAMLLAAVLATGSGLLSGSLFRASEAPAYTASEVEQAAAADLEETLLPLRTAGLLDRHTAGYERTQRVFDRIVEAVRRDLPQERARDWVLHVSEGRLPEAYSRAGGRVVVSARFLELYQPGDDELALILGHEVAHVLCEHERMKLSAVLRRNAPYPLQVRHAMEYLDTEPMVRAQVAGLVQTQERVADRAGLQLAAAAGYDPVAGLQFFENAARIDRQYGVPAAVHDAPAARRADLQGAAWRLRFFPALFADGSPDCAL